MISVLRRAIVLSAIALMAACAQGAGNEIPPGANGSMTQYDTPDGEAVVELIIEPREADIDEQVSFWLVNRGEVHLGHGHLFEVQEWDGDQWVKVPWPRNFDASLVLEPLPAGQESEPQRWPMNDQGHSQPGWYRIEWPVRWEDEPDYEEPDMEFNVSGRFEVRD